MFSSLTVKLASKGGLKFLAINLLLEIKAFKLFRDKYLISPILVAIEGITLNLPEISMLVLSSFSLRVVPPATIPGLNDK